MSTNHLKSLTLTAAPARGDKVIERRAHLVRQLNGAVRHRSEPRLHADRAQAGR